MKNLFIFTLLLSVSFTVNAQEGKENLKPKSDDVANIMLASQLAKYGYETYSATSLIEAARILSQIETQPLKYESVTKGKGEKRAKEARMTEFSVENLLKDARMFADGDKALLALADKISTNDEHRGRLGGPGTIKTAVQAKSKDTYEIYFKKGMLAEILVSGDGDTDLDLYVYDNNGNLIENDVDFSDDCYVKWVPVWTGSFTVEVVNRGIVYNNYVLITN